MNKPQEGSVSAQRQQVVTLKGDKIGVRTTAILPKLLKPAPCGTATGRRTDNVIRLAN